MGCKSLGTLLAAQRQRRGLTQRDLAARVGMGVSHVSRLEAGLAGVSVANLSAIAVALELTPEECHELLHLGAEVGRERAA